MFHAIVLAHLMLGGYSASVAPPARAADGTWRLVTRVGTFVTRAERIPAELRLALSGEGESNGAVVAERSAELPVLWAGGGETSGREPGAEK